MERPPATSNNSSGDSGPSVIIFIVIIVLFAGASVVLIVCLVVLRRKNNDLAKRLGQAEEQNEQLLSMTDRLQPTGAGGSTASLDNYQDPSDAVQVSQAPEDPYSLPDMKTIQKPQATAQDKPQPASGVVNEESNHSTIDESTRSASKPYTKTAVSMSQVAKDDASQDSYSYASPSVVTKQANPYTSVKVDDEEAAYATATEDMRTRYEQEQEKETEERKSLDVYREPLPRCCRAFHDNESSKRSDPALEDETADELVPEIPAKLYED